MRFQVPQFIEIEDKIFGPLTLRQFIYLAGTVGLIVIFWVLLPNFLALLLGAPFAAFGAALAFWKVNDRPFINTVESAFLYIFSNRLYLWKKEERPATPKQKNTEGREERALLSVPTVSKSRLKDLAWSLDIKESIYSGRNQQK